MSDAGSRCSANVGPAGISSRTWQAPFRLSDLTCHSVSLALRSGRPGASSGGEPSRRCLSPTISPVASLVSEETSHGCSGASQKCLTGKGWFGWRPRIVPTQREPSPGRQPVSAPIPPCHPVVLGPLWMRDCDLHRAAVHTGKEGVWKTPPRRWPGWERTRSVLAVTVGAPEDGRPAPLALGTAGFRGSHVRPTQLQASPRGRKTEEGERSAGLGSMETFQVHNWVV